MDKLQLTRQNLGLVFNSSNGCLHDVDLQSFVAKLPILKLKNQPRQLLACIVLEIALVCMFKVKIYSKLKFSQIAVGNLNKWYFGKLSYEEMFLSQKV
jgi:hypothetical protein